MSAPIDRRAAAGALVLALAACSADKPAPLPAATATATVAAKPASTAPRASASATSPRPTGGGPLAAKAAQHEKAIGAAVAAINAHDAKALAALYDPGCVVLGPSPGGWSAESGREPLVMGHEALFASQPDVRVASARLFVIGDFAVQEWVTTGTNREAGKAVGFRAATVYRFGSDGLIKRDSTYFDLLTPAVQSGRRPGEARPIPALPEKTEIAVAAGSRDEERRVKALRDLYDALVGKRSDDVGKLLADDVTHSSLLAVGDLAGRDAVRRDLEAITARLPTIEVTEAWGDGNFAIAEVVWSAPPGDSGRESKQHALHVVELAGDRIARSTLYANRREIE